MGEDSIEDSVHAGFIGEDAHGPGSSSELAESPFNKIGGTDLLPEISVLNLEEGQEFFLAFLERGEGFGVEVAPFGGEVFQSGSCLTDSFGIADASQVLLGNFLIRFSDMIQDVSGFVSPTALDRDARIDEG